MILKYTISFGTVLAVVISWSRNKSVLWAIIHGLFSWFYVFYYYIGADDDERKEKENNSEK